MTDDPARSRVSEDLRAALATGDGRAASAALLGATDEADPDLLAELVGVRHRGFQQLQPEGPTAWPPATAERFSRGAVPEVPVADLTAEVLAAALEHQSCLLVRGLIPEAVATNLMGDVQRSLDAIDAHESGTAAADTAPWYVPFEPAQPYAFGAIDRAFTRQLGGVLSVESPASLAHVVEAFADVGLGELLAEYFGEWPALSAKKSTLRRAQPTSPTEWHQDGAFLGLDTRSVNVWLALNDCGIAAPSLDIVPEAYDHIIDTGGSDALFSWSVSPEAAAGGRDVTVARPVFGPGDALLFNQLTLHRTGVERSMTQDRYAIESWFFAPSTYPHEQVPLLF